ncbi:5-deoxy-glucuronate isomerase [Alicyclobacillus shizuokensis]|uniref:5-deoxy-glucuronate isomerase n=1 Tax=Alicyclobacillus shizuokensis TaxID=392014 RepID=UPI00082CB086|nr:5-deoxy-glucuronate isomerase [Alicyclobacillus shizuokensis]MCL6627669.1 5-deoxy-glucuronate isomerase [Alicyclobacillus shizuokensis]
MLLVKSQEFTGYRELVGSTNPGGLRLLRFGVLRLGPGERHQGQFADVETVLLLLSGQCEVEVGGATYRSLQRSDVFAERATAVYVPVRASFTVSNTGPGPLEVAVCQAPASEEHTPFVVRPEEVKPRLVGRDNYSRYVHDVVVKEAEGKVQRIIVGETFNLPGNWSSYPPHKHDDYQPGVEACMEEVYYYRLKPRQGFGLQAIYTKDRSLDEVHRVEHGDVFLIPRGYHPVCAAAGYELYYLWVMAGDIDRVMIPHDDPDHAWVHNA